MASTNGCNIILGNPTPFYNDEFNPVDGQKFLDVLKAYGFTDIDTARVYVAGEKNFGLVKAASQGFVIDTKVNSFFPGAHKPESIYASVKTSFELLGVDKVHILYLHSPDRATPFEDTLRAMNELYKQGKYEKLGLSNFSASEVAQVVSIADKNGFVRPTVYQGNYSLLVRKGETELFPLLRKEKIAFYAWSPLAGGILTGRFASSEEANAGTKFNHEAFGPIYKSLFVKDSFFSALSELWTVAKAHNLSPIETSLRWLAYHSLLNKVDGDAIILGGSTPAHYENNIKELQRGPLPAPVVDACEKLWEKVKSESPPYHN